MSRDAAPSADEARARIRAGLWTVPTTGLAPGFVQANLVIVPEQTAGGFEAFCGANSQALPLLDRTEPGSPVPARVAPTVDLRTDLPRYRLIRDGRLVEQVTDIVTLWHADSVAFLLGCSLSFQHQLEQIGTRRLEPGRNVPMYITNRMTEAAGGFSGPLVVSMRPIPQDAVERLQETARGLPLTHGEPLHVGPAGALGIVDLDAPDFGEPLTVAPGEVPVFWACGVTALAAAMHSKTPWMITHEPGHMLITDLTLSDIEESSS